MRNFKMEASRETLQRGSYRISRSSDAYDFFDCEYRNLPRDMEGNIIFAGEEVRIPRVLHFFRKRNQAIVVKANSSEHSFFQSEYSYRMPEDVHHNLIVPVEEYPERKVR